MDESKKINKNAAPYENAFSSFSSRSIKRLKKQPYLLIPGFLAYLRGIYYRVK